MFEISVAVPLAIDRSDESHDLQLSRIEERAIFRGRAIAADASQAALYTRI
jgi:hypothetical protein